MKGKPSIDSFLEGGKHEVAKSRADSNPEDKRTKKIFELPESLVIALERRCTDERASRGRRITQREVVEALLQKWVRGDVVL